MNIFCPLPSYHFIASPLLAFEHSPLLFYLPLMCPFPCLHPHLHQPPLPHLCCHHPLCPCTLCAEVLLSCCADAFVVSLLHTGIYAVWPCSHPCLCTLSLTLLLSPSLHCLTFAPACLCALTFAPFIN